MGVSEERPAGTVFAGEVWLGDVVHAWQALGVTSAAERSIVAELFGFDLEINAAPGEIDAAPGLKDTAEQPPSGPVVPSRPPDDDNPVQTASAIEDAELVVPMAPAVTVDAAPTVPAWRVEAVPLQSERSEHIEFAPTPEPLFVSRWTRAILGAICSTPSEDGPFDIDTLVERLARCEAIAELPRDRVATLRRGIQLLVDHGQSMMPFMRDVEELSRRIAQVVGRDRTQVAHFSAFPEDGAGPGGPSTWRKPYLPPPAGTPVVLITELGQARGGAIRDAASDEDWLAFGAKLAAAGCVAIAIVPLPLVRVRSLAKAFRILSWDTTTTISQARRAAAGDQS